MQHPQALRFATILSCSLLLTTQATAQTAVSQEKVTAGDVVTKPLSDLNIKKDEVPEILVTARSRPYDLSGLNRCAALGSAIANLDAVLGDDIDIARDDGNATIDMGNLAKSVVGSLIPFGGVIREISGANAQQRKWNEAIYAGSVRRAFLKGIGHQRGCNYPARAASAKDAAAVHAARDAAEAREKAEKDTDKKDSGSDGGKTPREKSSSRSNGDQPVRFENKPVVQKTD